MKIVVFMKKKKIYVFIRFYFRTSNDEACHLLNGFMRRSAKRYAGAGVHKRLECLE